jgi:catechol 2,3-dioxygenase-like lactoylglutathione lyase family enzyme
VQLTHVRVLVEDFSASFRFYRDALGLPTRWEDNGGYADFPVGESLWLAIFPRGQMEAETRLRPAGDGAVLALGVEDVDAAFASLGERGVQFVDEPHDRPDWGLRVAHARDPDGNLIELYHDIEWSP